MDLRTARKGGGEKKSGTPQGGALKAQGSKKRGIRGGGLIDPRKRKG